MIEAWEPFMSSKIEATLGTKDEPAAGYQRPLMAGWLSLMVHLVLIIGGVLWLRTQPLRSLEEPGRNVGIVLASSASPSDVQYFDESTESGAESSATDADSSTAETSTPVSALPDAASKPASSAQIELPGAVAPAIEGVELDVANAKGGRAGRAILDPTAGMADILAAEARRPRAKGPQGPPGEVSIFGAGTTRGHSFVFVIDRSQSMGSEGLGAIAAAEVELLAALDKLQSNHQFQVVAYNQATTYFQQRKLVSVSDDSRLACREFLANLAAFGATDHERAIMSALQLKPDVLYLLTDGDPTLTPAQRKRIRDEARGRTTISSIQFGRIRPDEESTRKALESLARENGGTYVFVDMAKR